jgi:hypothetical protein
MHDEIIAIPLTCFMTGCLTNSRGIPMATMILNLCCGLVAPVRLRNMYENGFDTSFAGHCLEHRAINRPLLPGKLASSLEWSSLPGPANLVADEYRSQLAIHPSKYEHARGVVSRVSKAATMGDPSSHPVHPSLSSCLRFKFIARHAEHGLCLNRSHAFRPSPSLKPLSRERKRPAKLRRVNTYLLRPLISSIILDDS